MKKIVLCTMYYVLCLSVVPSVHAKNLIPELGRSGPLHWSPPPVLQKTLPNGFRLYLLPDSSLPLFKVELYLETGEAYVPVAKSGLADLMASTWTSGGTQTKTPQRVDQWLEENAIHISSESGRELTTISLSALSPKADEALHFFQELLFKPGFDAKRFRLAKRHFQESVRRLPDQPNALLSQTFRELVYPPNHPWGSHPSLKTLRKIQREDILSFYQKWFQPNRMLLTVAGDFSPQAISQWVEQQFGGLAQVEVPSPEWKELAFTTTPELKRVKKKLTQAFIEVGHFSLRRDSPERYAYGLLQYLLGGDPFISRLGKDLRTTLGLAYHVSSDWDLNPVRGLFKIHIETKQASEAVVLNKIKEHLERIQAGEIAPEELDRAKQALLHQYIFWFDSPFAMVTQKAKLDLLGYEPDYLEKYPGRLKRVTLEEVKGVAKKYIQPDQLKIVIVGP